MYLTFASVSSTAMLVIHPPKGSLRHCEVLELVLLNGYVKQPGAEWRPCCSLIVSFGSISDSFCSENCLA